MTMTRRTRKRGMETQRKKETKGKGSLWGSKKAKKLQEQESACPQKPHSSIYPLSIHKSITSVDCPIFLYNQDFIALIARVIAN